MCGIIGYVGKKPAKDILIDGLAKLEYRGYDSAGIALLNDDDTLTIKKKAGRVEDLREMCSDDSPVYRSTCGIGHTRWATHGGVTDVNAHPHRCGDVALIHNGIIENYNDIVREYGLADRLVSETDTEVVAALLDTLYDGNPIETIRKAVKAIAGSFALCDNIIFKGILCCAGVSYTGTLKHRHQSRRHEGEHGRAGDAQDNMGHNGSSEGWISALYAEGDL